MNAQELLCYLTGRATDSFIKTLRSVPSESLDWTPGPGTRSPRDMAQEIATVLQRYWSAFSGGEMNWSPEEFGNWVAERSKITELDDLEKGIREATEKLCAHIMQLDEKAFDTPVTLPWGEQKVADTLAYHYWNLSYHEGQINTILQLLEAQKG